MDPSPNGQFACETVRLLDTSPRDSSPTRQFAYSLDSSPTGHFAAKLLDRHNVKCVSFAASFVFTARCSYACAILGVIILSVHDYRQALDAPLLFHLRPRERLCHRPRRLTRRWLTAVDHQCQQLHRPRPLRSRQQQTSRQLRKTSR